MLQVSLGRILMDSDPMKCCKSVSRSFLNEELEGWVPRIS